jgi:hypothetical protein
MLMLIFQFRASCRQFGSRRDLAHVGSGWTVIRSEPSTNGKPTYEGVLIRPIGIYNPDPVFQSVAL